jgi:hypothetical protein
MLAVALQAQSSSRIAVNTNASMDEYRDPSKQDHRHGHQLVCETGNDPARIWRGGIFLNHRKYSMLGFWPSFPPC